MYKLHLITYPFTHASVLYIREWTNTQVIPTPQPQPNPFYLDMPKLLNLTYPFYLDMTKLLNLTYPFYLNTFIVLPPIPIPMCFIPQQPTHQGHGFKATVPQFIDPQTLKTAPQRYAAFKKHSAGYVETGDVG